MRKVLIMRGTVFNERKLKANRKFSIILTQYIIFTVKEYYRIVI